ncbi:MAG TPA: NUDIX domain-containing protein [Verrucomicrobiae bacterium]|jgi:predicted NUDIX family NTP pyrophosphohydrolase
MRAKVSAGLLLFRFRNGALEIFLAHPGGPFFARKDDGHWTIPKGEIEGDEDFLATAIRECKEEVCIDIDPKAKFFDLGSIRQKGGKIVHAWGAELDLDKPPELKSNLFQMEWPPKSGKFDSFPEVDRAQFFPIQVARRKIKESQIPLIDRLESLLASGRH